MKETKRNLLKMQAVFSNFWKIVALLGAKNAKKVQALRSLSPARGIEAEQQNAKRNELPNLMDDEMALNEQPDEKERVKRPCIYCGQYQAQLLRHMKRKHNDEEAVKAAMMLPKQDQHNAFDKLRKLEGGSLKAGLKLKIGYLLKKLIKDDDYVPNSAVSSGSDSDIASSVCVPMLSATEQPTEIIAKANAGVSKKAQYQKGSNSQTDSRSHPEIHFERSAAQERPKRQISMEKRECVYDVNPDDPFDLKLEKNRCVGTDQAQNMSDDLEEEFFLDQSDGDDDYVPNSAVSSGSDSDIASSVCGFQA
ncbi:hypothetical protein EGW08_015409 [Elysia chlorotica]|uniref:Uncharacterized protein n=1 Tax=Elysia chlorotica TaxID=188477 RepID=A0A3S0ZW95_ELYCH|nr:hypothetical protein EGW08_015409 [Elysia chlorotica]